MLAANGDVFWTIMAYIWFFGVGAVAVFVLWYWLFHEHPRVQRVERPRRRWSDY
jgi:hypothetical protein